MFRIVIPGGPAEEYVERCLDSLVGQSERDWRAQVVLDPVGDRTYEKALRYRSDRIAVVRNDEPACALANIVKGVDLLGCADDDVVVTVDADDWLRHADALAIVRSYYERFPQTLVTHGSWVFYPGYRDGTNNRPYLPYEFETGLRRHVFKGSHLRTMKYKVFRRIRDEDLRDRNGRYFRSAGDMAITFPALEMAGPSRVTFVAERIYVYNRETPYGEMRLRAREQRAMGLEICLKRPYPVCGEI